MLENGKEVLLPTTNSFVNIVDVTKVTRSGRVFGPVFPKDVEDISKKVEVPTANLVSALKFQYGESNNMKPNNDEETAECSESEEHGDHDQVRVKPTLDTSWEALKDHREIPNGLYLFSKIDPPERTREPSEKPKKAKKAKLGESSGSRPLVPLVGSPGKSVSLPRFVKIKPTAFSLPQTTLVDTSAETPPSTTKSSNPPSLKFNLATTTLPVSEAEMLNETTSPSASPSPQSPPYYELSSDTEPSDPQSPTLAQLQARALAFQQPSHLEPEPEVTSIPPEHPTTFELPQTPPAQQPIHSEPQPTQPPSELTPQPAPSSYDRPFTFSEQVRNDFVRDIGIRLQESLAREAEEWIRKEAEEKVCQEELQTVREAEAKDAADAAATAVVEAEAKAKADAEEEAHIVEEAAAKANNGALTQGEHSNSGFIPLVLKTLEELQKEQQVIRARLVQQDSINVNIQNMMS
ncbi:uncharacterized protein LOC127122687 [Lathyrus oleraceus]|uniref:uncharacterized protein LOC127122687 n=1 Tax=Pisum sativum TaxID=3888 RepID=UPI0021CE6D5C|nr:uncharacterized protein LOC127122687 [Pisum sativum]